MWPVYLARLLLLVSVLVGLVLLVGSLLPRSFQVEYSTTIDAAPEEIYAHVSDLQQWLTWSPWSQVAGEARVVRNADGRVDALHWNDPRGDGKLWLVSCNPPQQVVVRLTSGYFQEVEGEINLAGAHPTRVRWTLRGRFPGGPFYGYFRWFFPGEMRQQMARSLERLDTLCNPPLPSDR